LVAALAVIPYVNTVRNGFVLDDVSIVAENPMIRDLGNVGAMVRTNYWATTGRDASVIDPGLYRPLSILSYAVDYRIWSLEPFGYHLTNVLLHAAASVVVLLLAFQTLGSPVAATVAAACFAVHPMHTEAVSSIVGRAEVLATLFFLLAFRRLRLRTSSTSIPSGRTWFGVVFGAVLYLLGLLSKETAVTLPAVLAADDWLQRRDLRENSNAPARGVVLARYAALGAALSIYLLLRQTAVTEPAKQWPGFVGVSLWHRMLTASRVLAEYLGLFVFPRTLSADYWKSDVPIATSVLNGPVLFSLALWVAIAAIAWKLRRERALVLGLAWFFITIAPASNVFFASGIGKAERILYLPSVGLCLVAAWAYARVEAATTLRRWLPILAAPVVLVLATRTYRRNVDWRDNLTLALATLKVSPESPLMNDIAAGELVKRGDPRSAIPLIQDAIRQAPTMPGLHTHLGVAYYQQGSIPEAIQAYRRALQHNPNDADARANLGLAFLDAQQTDSAAAQLEEARRLRPGDARVENNLGVARMRRGELENAAEHFQRALQLRPDYAGARANLDRVTALRAGGSKK
jgi:tetratricopeptide (TPR) repeat protein